VKIFADREVAKILLAIFRWQAEAAATTLHCILLTAFLELLGG
jgi:hypothetical protein